MPLLGFKGFSFMQIVKAAILCSTLALTACSNWVYRIDVPQGNYMEQQLVDKLRVQMTKEQVHYILGSPVAKNPFKDDKWHYVYNLRKGKGGEFRSELVIHFENDKVIDMTGDFDRPEEFDTPLDQ